MKRFTGGYWSALGKSVRDSSTFFKERQAEANKGSLPIAAVDRHLGRIPVEDLQPFGNVCHADAGSAESVRPFHQLRRAHANTIILDFDNKIFRTQSAAKINAASFHFRRESMLDRV